MERGIAPAALAAIALALIASASGACSSSGSASNAPPPGGDGGADADAGPDYHDTYPAPHPPFPEMHYFGGRVIPQPSIVTVTFAGMDATLRDSLRDFDDKITTTPWWASVMSGYAVNAGVSGGYAELPDTLSGTNTTDDQLSQLIANAITSDALPAPTDATIYNVYAPYNAIIELSATDQSCQAFAGYHHSGLVVQNGKSQRFLYSIVNDCVGTLSTAKVQKDNLTYVASHELAETATDPDVNTSDNGGWYMVPGNDAWVGVNGGENADLCGGQSWKEGDWFVTKVWNAEAVKASKAPCQPASPAWYFAAAPWTENPHRDQGSGPNADGYVTVKAGTSRDVEVDVFSTEKLPGDLTLLAGRFAAVNNASVAPYDPYKVYAPYPGVTTTLSKNTGTNGDRLTLTITVDAALSNVKKRFWVRAVLSPTDYHTWPAILYVP